MPASMWRCTFSTTTIASSTTRPMAMTIASNVSRLIEKPISQIRKSTPTRDSGIATSGISTTRGEPRNSRITSITMAEASSRVIPTCRNASVMKIEESESIRMRRSAGNWPCSPVTEALIRSATSSGLAPGAGVIDMYTVARPLENARNSSSSLASASCATSPSRTRRSPS